MNNIFLTNKKFSIVFIGCVLVCLICVFMFTNRGIQFSVIPSQGTIKGTKYTVSITEAEQASKVPNVTTARYYNYSIKHPDMGNDYKLKNISTMGISGDLSESEREYAVITHESKSFLITKAKCGMSESGYCFQVFNVSEPNNIKDLGSTNEIVCKEPEVEGNKLVFTRFKPKCSEFPFYFPWEEKQFYYIELS